MTRKSPSREWRAETEQMGAVRLLRLFGIDVFIHWSWLIIFVLVSWSLAGSELPRAYPRWAPATYWFVGVLTALLFFASVLAHEFSHSLVARARGIPVQSIMLFVFGGVSALGGEPRRARDEFWIAIVGPLTSFVISAIAFAAWLAAATADATVIKAITAYLALINLSVGIFNLLPGFPLDGGRVLRAGVWGARRNLLEATRVAAGAGQVLAALLIGFGVFLVLATGLLSGVWLMLIGWFLWNAAQSGYRQLLIERSLAGLTVAPLIESSGPWVRPGMTLRQLATDGVLGMHRRAFFVSAPDADEELAGLITLTDLRRAPEAEWDALTVGRAMTPRPRLIAVTPETPLLTALQLMVRHDLNQLPVMVGDRPVGLLSRAGLLRALQQRLELAGLSEMAIRDRE